MVVCSFRYDESASSCRFSVTRPLSSGDGLPVLGLDHLREVVLEPLHRVLRHVGRTHHGTELHRHLRGIDALLLGRADVGEVARRSEPTTAITRSCPARTCSVKSEALPSMMAASPRSRAVIRAPVSSKERNFQRVEGVLQNQPGQRVVRGAGTAALHEGVGSLLGGVDEVGECTHGELAPVATTCGSVATRVIGVNWSRLTAAFSTVIGWRSRSA